MTEDPCVDADTTDNADELTLTPQQRAALTREHNIALTAGAGTGKTTTLIERYREILTQEPTIDPDQILTLTFTTDATTELQDRVRDMIDEELAAADPGAYGRWRRATDALEDAYIHTIHGFCSRILREFAVEAGIHPEFETLDEGAAETLIEEAVTTVLDGEDRPPAPPTTAGGAVPSVAVDPEWDLGEALTTLTRVYSRNSLETALVSLFDERPDSVTWADRWAPQAPEDYVADLAERVDVSITPTEADTLIETEAAQTAIAEIQRLGQLDPDLPADDNGRALLTELMQLLETTDAHTPSGTTADRQRFLLTVATGVTTGSGTLQSQTWRYAGSKGTWTDHGYGEEREAFREALETLADVIEPETRNLDHDPAVTRRGAEQAIALARVFQATRQVYQRLKARRTALDYSDLITRATDFLADHDAARQTLRDQFAYIMVDEVQDTDPRQWDLVRLLSGADPDRFDGGNVFLVGDDKQSIYRFRDADVTQFRAARERLIADTPPDADADLELTGNFRTLESTLTAINELFAEVLQPAARDANSEADGDGTGGVESDTAANDSSAATEETAHDPYEAPPQWLDACRQEGTAVEGTVEYLVVPDDEDADAALGLAESWFTADPFVDRAQREATALAARLTQLLASDRQVYDREQAAVVDLQPRHIALLFRSSRRLPAFERAFDAQDIPYTNLAGSGLYDTPELQPLVNLLQVFEDPTADIPLYGVLRSPLFGFTDEAIVTARDPAQSLWAGLEEADPALQAARERIATWRAAAGLGDDPAVTHWSTLLSRIIDETGYLVGIGADERPQQAVANVEQFRAQLRAWEEGSARSVTDLLERIQQAREGDEDPGEATIPGEVEGVQLRTIHSAKGLEFPVVVVPELTRRFNMRSSIPRAHFERIDEEPVLGMKAPAPDDGFEITSSAAYLHVRDHHRRRERAEQRRLLYVAATRARDQLLFSGTHSVDPDTESGLPAPGDWAEARRWTDWVQPTLLSEPGLVDRLAADGQVVTGIGKGTVTIRRPTPPADWEPPAAETAVPSDLEIPAPSRTTPRLRLSATGFRDRLAEAPDRPASLREEGGTPPDPATIDDEMAIAALDAATVGSVVHKLCELDAPESEWPTIIRRTVDDPDAVTDAAIEAITAHATAGRAGRQRLEADEVVQSRHSELSVQLDLDQARVVGDIDHLAVLEDGYLVIDYKTSDLSTHAIEDLTEHYLPQLVAYAGALLQNDSAADRVEIALIFTDTGAVRQRSLSRSDTEALLEWAGTVL